MPIHNAIVTGIIFIAVVRFASNTGTHEGETAEGRAHVGNDVIDALFTQGEGADVGVSVIELVEAALGHLQRGVVTADAEFAPAVAGQTEPLVTTSETGIGTIIRVHAPFQHVVGLEAGTQIFVAFDAQTRRMVTHLHVVFTSQREAFEGLLDSADRHVNLTVQSGVSHGSHRSGHDSDNSSGKNFLVHLMYLFFQDRNGLKRWSI